MARVFDNASAQYLTVAGTPVTGPPFTISCWGYNDENTSLDAAVTVGLSSDHYYMLCDSSGTLQAYQRGSTAVAASATAGVTTSTWEHYCAVFAASNDRRCYIQGGNRGDDATACTTDPATTLQIGGRFANLYWSGYIAEVFIWKAALTDYEVWQHYMGKPPWLIRPGNLVMQVPFLYGRTWDRDIQRGLVFTPNNGPTWAPHPPKAQRYWLEHDMRLFRRLAKAPAAGETLSVGISGDNESYWRSGPLVVGSG